jgi:hypothetical protein
MDENAEWLECLTANAKSHNSPGFNPSILLHSGIYGSADEAVVLIKKFPKSQ